MKCNDALDMLYEYWDMPEHDPRRQEIEGHIAGCASCREEFDIWKQSAELIRSTRMEPEPPASGTTISSGVMERIYRDESWRLPVAWKTYSFSFKVRRNIMLVFAMCLALFAGSFIHSVLDEPLPADEFTELTGIIDTAHAKGGAISGGVSMFEGIPVASLSTPTVIRMGPVQTYSDYLMALSILGFVFMLLIMNWLSRLRA